AILEPGRPELHAARVDGRRRQVLDRGKTQRVMRRREGERELFEWMVLYDPRGRRLAAGQVASQQCQLGLAAGGKRGGERVLDLRVIADDEPIGQAALKRHIVQAYHIVAV